MPRRSLGHYSRGRRSGLRFIADIPSPSDSRTGKISTAKKSHDARSSTYCMWSMKILMALNTTYFSAAPEIAKKSSGFMFMIDGCWWFDLSPGGWTNWKRISRTFDVSSKGAWLPNSGLVLDARLSNRALVASRCFACNLNEIPSEDRYVIFAWGSQTSMEWSADLQSVKTRMNTKRRKLDQASCLHVPDWL